MDADEREIYNYLSGFGEEWVNAKEICRRAGGKKRYNDDNNWARPVLRRMKDRSILEGDLMGRFRIRPSNEHEEESISPDIQDILKEDGDEAGAEKPDTISDDTIEQP